MPMLHEYEQSAGDWRLQLKRNERRTLAVMTAFVLLFLCVGLLVDVYVIKTTNPSIPIPAILSALITLHVLPIATLILGLVAIGALLLMFLLHDRIMLLGTDSREITPQSAQTLSEKQLYNVVEEMKVAAGLRYMPRVYIIDANYMNAFASGYSEKSAMVAITKGLMEKLERAELQAVMAHELSHIRHHDIKLTLAVGVLSNILLIVIDSIFYSVFYNRDENREVDRLFTVVLILRYLLPMITVGLTLFLNRTREYMADSGAVELMRDNSPMASALLKISQDSESHAQEYVVAYGRTAHEHVRRASYLFDPSDLNPIKSLINIFSTHPTIEERLKAIGFKKR